MIKRSLVVAVVLALGLGACSSGSSGGSDGAKAKPSKTTTTKADTGGNGSGADDAPSCAKAEAAKVGYVQAFCDGPATVSFDIGGTAGEIDGGECTESGGYFTINAGIVVDTEWKGDRPDYAGFLLPLDEGDFSGDQITAAIVTGGEFITLGGVTGTRDADKVTFSGTDAATNAKVDVTVTC